MVVAGGTGRWSGVDCNRIRDVASGEEGTFEDVVVRGTGDLDTMRTRGSVDM